MDTLRCVFIDASHEILVNLFCHERDHRSGSLGYCHKCCIQCHVCINLILLHSFCPKTLTASSYIPVAHVIYKLLEHTRRLWDAVIAQIIIDSFYHRVHLGKEPFIHYGKFFIFQRIFCRVELVDIRIENKECISIPQCTHEFSLSFCHGLSVEAVRQPRSAVDIEVPADCVGSVFLKGIERIYRISLGLAHLLAVLVLHMSEDDDILVRRLIEDQCGDRQQGVEPSSCLVYRLGNEVCRELFLKQLLILERIVVLSKRHGSAVEPAVNNFRNTVHLFAALRALDRHGIDVRTVQFDVVRTVVGHFFQFCDASDGVHVSALTFPDIERGSPVTVTADAPVLNILDPIAETSFTDALRNPVDRVIIRDQVVPYYCHLDEPGLARIVDQRRVTSPAVRIAVLELRCIKEKASRIQIF